jgi:conjugative transposon TraJ protein
MKLPYSKIATMVAVYLVFPFWSFSQRQSNLDKLQTVLKNVQVDLMPECQRLINISTALAGFGAIFYIGYRVWKHIAAAEPIDFFPLLRPFCLTLLIGMFPLVLKTFDALLDPVVMTTDQMVKDSNRNVNELLIRNAKAIVLGTDQVPMAPGDNQEWRKYYQPGVTVPADNDPSFSFGASILTNAMTALIKLLLSKTLELLYFAAVLCINTMRTFHLVILGLLGPIVFAFSIYDGLHHTLSIWIARYINIYLWLPVCNLFGFLLGKIQASMLQIDYAQMVASGETMFTQTDMAYMVFLTIAIFGYFSVPSITNFIIHASGGSPIMQKATSFVVTSGRMIASTVVGGTPGGAGSMVGDVPGPDTNFYPMADAKNSEPYLNDANSYQSRQLKG